MHFAHMPQVLMELVGAIDKEQLIHSVRLRAICRVMLHVQLCVGNASSRRYVQ